MSDLAERFGKLARDREELNRTDHWFGHDSKDVLSERRRVVAESWDVLVALRKLLRDRQDLLQQLQAHVVGKISELEEQCVQALDKADYIKAEPVRGPAWVDGLAENDDVVVALQNQIAPLRGVLEKLQTLHYRASQNTALTFRQREVYEQLN